MWEKVKGAFRTKCSECKSPEIVKTSGFDNITKTDFVQVKCTKCKHIEVIK